LLIGADSYETLDEMRASQAQGIPPVGIGSDSIIEGAIIDKNARIGRGVHIVNQPGSKRRMETAISSARESWSFPRMVSSRRQRHLERRTPCFASAFSAPLHFASRA